ncbi:MAG: hypothetical protein KDB57_08865 [Solirubrobacterales bacterium]|nr:hypothetical protein [Solirubrobacterales bacterium]
MSESPDQGQTGSDGRIPRLAIGVVIVGVLASLAIYGLSHVPGSGSVEIDWDTTEEIAAPPATDVGTGSFGVSRTSLSALAPNEEGVLLYRVAGVVRVASGGRQPTRVRCDVTSRSAGDTKMARSTKLRAAWPKPSDDLQLQEVPETSLVKFDNGDNNKIDLPIRDVARRYVDISAPVTVDWLSYVEDDQYWIWRMTEGTGAGTATLPWLVIFEAENRPKGLIECSATIGGERTKVEIPFLQEEWPIVDDQPNTGEADTGDVSNVE